MTIKQAKRREYGEKKFQTAFCLTHTAQANLKEMAISRNIATSELIERIARGILVVSEPSENSV